METTKIITPEYTIKLRNLEISDYPDIKEAAELAYSGMGGVWQPKHIAKLLEIFPEGQLCIELNGKVIACALSLIVDYSRFRDTHTYVQITGNYEFTTHNADGDVLYGIDVFIHPSFRGMRLGRRLYNARKELCENLNLRSIIAGGRIPGFITYADKLTPKEYIEKVKLREIYDPILSFQIANDFHVKKILTNYLPYDSDSKAFATLLEWNNIYYEENKKQVGDKKSVVRIGIAQWQMRTVEGIEAMIEQIEFFVDAVSGYKSDFILFPELFNAPLMAAFNQYTESAAIRMLAGYTEQLRNKFCEFAVNYNVNIITGSMPLYEDGKLYNVAFLCRRNGTWDSQYKLHITPNESYHWGVVGGDTLKIFETDCGKIGILICYDVEFPELPRLLAAQGMDLLFVPFLTDTQNGYNRVRLCAHARAVENECYVAIAGSVGNLPRVNNMDIQYAQSAVFSPSDFPFPTNAIVSEATPNAEMMLISDVNLDLLKELHINGSVKNLKDRRTDLYSLTWRGKS
ncbi:GNAT family N-acetyltransferase [Rhodocytophaga rosea]|uniref:GNAT family N-acetyltransferase n=1 Tax=Rhodocytophaga rosea TaxID=2704465 RepID=A0A6C0GFE8_9BACT|nr:bifunctional GNAT family N-acetyltransferase/carbon-nitrogen hydrolase family protein [Rhodocytophaga rosea]QHT66688.1 GNAT family N-acetyltransferase [Rhodocytophaga rosea]